MTTSDDAMLNWLEGLANGEEHAIAAIWETCSPRLIAAARAKLLPATRRMGDNEEDVAITAFHAFCRAAKTGAIPPLSNSSELLALLIRITQRRAVSANRKITAEKRGKGNIRGHSVCAELGFSDFDQFVPQRSANRVMDRFSDALGDVLSRLGDPQLEEVALAKLEGFTNKEIAERLGLAERTIERRINRIRELWSLDESAPPE